MLRHYDFHFNRSLRLAACASPETAEPRLRSGRRHRQPDKFVRMHEAQTLSTKPQTNSRQPPPLRRRAKLTRLPLMTASIDTEVEDLGRNGPSGSPGFGASAALKKPRR